MSKLATSPATEPSLRPHPSLPRPRRTRRRRAWPRCPLEECSRPPPLALPLHPQLEERRAPVAARPPLPRPRRMEERVLGGRSLTEVGSSVGPSPWWESSVEPSPSSEQLSLSLERHSNKAGTPHALFLVSDQTLALPSAVSCTSLLHRTQPPFPPHPHPLIT